MRSPLSLAAAVVVATAALSTSSAGLAAAEHGGGAGVVERQGSCSGSASWKLKAKPDDGRLKIEAEVDANRSGQVWSWRILHDGYVSFRGTRTTQGPSGSFSVERRVVDMSGQDSIGFRARNHASGQTCRGQLSY
jgi:hypothetical protein